MALSYARRGWAVIPLRGKLPLTDHGSRDAATDEDTIRGWWRRWPDADVGIATGAVSGGLVVLDVDVSETKRGDRVLVGLVRDLGPIPWSLEVLTGGCGAHHYFATPPGVRIGNSRSKVGPGLDVRGEGGYVVAPPSRHASGNLYSWVENGAPLATLSGWLLDAMVGGTEPDPPVARPDPGRYGSDLERRVERGLRYVDKMPGAVSGSGGHDQTWIAAVHLARGLELPREAVLAILETYNARCVPPWSRRELEHKVDSAIAQSKASAGYLLTRGAA